MRLEGSHGVRSKMFQVRRTETRVSQFRSWLERISKSNRGIEVHGANEQKRYEGTASGSEATLYVLRSRIMHESCRETCTALLRYRSERTCVRGVTFATYTCYASVKRAIASGKRHSVPPTLRHALKFNTE